MFYERSGMYGYEAPSRSSLIKEEESDTNRRIAFMKARVKEARYLDYGCGTGAVALGLREVCGKTCVVEPNLDHRRELSRENLDVFASIDEVNGEFDVVSLFHVLEHLRDPIHELIRIREKVRPGGTVVIEVPHARDALIDLYDCKEFKEFTYWSCHLFLFEQSTLGEVLIRAGFATVEFHYVQRYPISNHLYWLSKGRPGGHLLWPDLRNEELDRSYAARLEALRQSDTLVAVARTPMAGL